MVMSDEEEKGRGEKEEEGRFYTLQQSGVMTHTC
jgi:hypothetical protein